MTGQSTHFAHARGLAKSLRVRPWSPEWKHEATTQQQHEPPPDSEQLWGDPSSRTLFCGDKCSAAPFIGTL